MIRDIIEQARHELGVLRLLAECVFVPLALLFIMAALLLVTGG